MTGKETDCKGRINPSALELSLNNYKLPESLPCSIIEFPMLVDKNNFAKWHEILNEEEEKLQAIKKHQEKKTGSIPKSPFQRTQCDYINENVFKYLVPALENTLRKAKIWSALKHQKCFFNGIDHIAQELWNNNPKHPWRKLLNMHVFNMPWVRKELTMHPRPYYPKSWLWPEDYAATIIQKSIRRHFVLCDEEVQEMREFWMKLKIEHDVPDVEINPILAKKFALHRRSAQN